MKKRYSTVLYDWDGCLVRTIPIILDVYQETFARHGIKVSHEMIMKDVFGGWDGPLKLGITDLATFNKEFSTRLEEKTMAVQMYPHVPETLKELDNRGIAVAIVTTAQRQTVFKTQSYKILEEHIQRVIGAEDVQNHKPAPDVIFKALEQLGSSTDSALIVGDSVNDLGAANSAGINSVLFSPPDHEKFYSRESIIAQYKPTHIITDHREILKLL